MGETVTIDRRFCGPPESANGGYACGLVARAIPGPVEVTLRVPPPLDTPLLLEETEDGAVLLDGETIVAQGRPAAVDATPGEPVSVAEAVAAAALYPWRDGHPYPTCYVCGPARADGLGIYPGPVEGRSLFAAPWTPAGDEPELVWAALDCPSGIVTDLFGGVGRMLLGRLTAELLAPVQAGETHVVQAWPIARDGRKLHTASALFTASGDLVARARAVWIEVESPA
ncbi:MAG: hypothetical protein ACJ762_14235 [Solirubrobacteraceae bacterium]